MNKNDSLNNNNGYNTVVDKDFFINYPKEIDRMAEKFSRGLIDYQEKIIINSVSKHTVEIQNIDVDDAIIKGIEDLKHEKIRDDDIVILFDYFYSKNITENENKKEYKYNGKRYKIIDEVSTNGKVYILNKNKLPKLNCYKFNKNDYKEIDIRNISDDDRILICINDLSKDANYRKKIIEEKPDWLNNEIDKEQLLKTKVAIIIFQKCNINEDDEIVGYYIEK